MTEIKVTLSSPKIIATVTQGMNGKTAYQSAVTGGYTGTEAEFNSLIANIPSIEGTANTKYKIVACAIRNIGGIWTLINDASHTPVNVSSVEAVGTSLVRIHYDFTASKVGSLQVVPDEAYTENGISAGASVGLSYSDIVISQNKRIGGYTFFNGTEFTNLYLKDIQSLSFSSGVLTVNHAEIPSGYTRDIFGGAVSCRDGAYLPCFGSFGANSFQIQIRDYSGALITTPNTNMKLYFDRHFNGMCNVAKLDLPSSNFWILGIFEVA